VAASWSNLVSLPFLFFIFYFYPKKHHPPSTQRSHTSDPSSTNYHFNYNTLLIARAFGARLVYSLVSARVLCSEPRRSRTCCSRHLEPWQPVSLHTTRFSNFFATSNFCLLAIARRRDRLLYFYKTNNCNSQGLCLSKISDREFTNGATASSSTSV